MSVRARLGAWVDAVGRVLAPDLAQMDDNTAAARRAVGAQPFDPGLGVFTDAPSALAARRSVTPTLEDVQRAIHDGILGGLMAEGERWRYEDAAMMACAAVERLWERRGRGRNPDAIA